MSMKYMIHYGMLLILITTSIHAETHTTTFTRISDKHKTGASTECAAACLRSENCTGLEVDKWGRCEPVNDFHFYEECNPDTHACYRRRLPPCVESIHYNTDVNEIIVTYHGYDQVVRYPSDYPESINSIQHAQTTLEKLPKSSVFSYLPDDVKDIVFYQSGPDFSIIIFDGSGMAYWYDWDRNKYRYELSPLEWPSEIYFKGEIPSIIEAIAMKDHVMYIYAGHTEYEVVGTSGSIPSPWNMLVRKRPSYPWGLKETIHAASVIGSKLFAFVGDKLMVGELAGGQDGAITELSDDVYVKCMR